jgi:hypothetical protein
VTAAATSTTATATAFFCTGTLALKNLPHVMTSAFGTLYFISVGNAYNLKELFSAIIALKIYNRHLYASYRTFCFI